MTARASAAVKAIGFSHRTGLARPQGAHRKIDVGDVDCAHVHRVDVGAIQDISVAAAVCHIMYGGKLFSPLRIGAADSM